MKIEDYKSWQIFLEDGGVFKARKGEATLEEDGVLSFPEEYEPIVRQRYGKFLSSVSRGKARIRSGSEFDLIAEIVDRGGLPFRPVPVDPNNLREPQVNFDLSGKRGERAYQREAFERFKSSGWMGIYWPPSSGKTFISMYVMDSLKGRKLVICPSLLLIEQWKDDMREQAPRLLDETDVVTYQAYPKIRDNEYVCVVYDEGQRLPANQFSRMATIRAKYRLLLSATPFREDGRDNYIFALGGQPMGLDWHHLVKLLGRSFHEVDVWITQSEREKLRRVAELVNPSRKTVVFSDSIALGESISNKLGCPFVYGKTRKGKRLKIIREEPVVVVSRVGDLGISLKNLEHVVEASFLMGSRAQEVQRSTRLFHSMAKLRHHDILFTEDEFYRYRKRLHGLVEKGFKINMQTTVRAPVSLVELPRARRGRPRPAPAVREPRISKEHREAAKGFVRRKINQITKLINGLTPRQRRMLKFLMIARKSYAGKMSAAVGFDATRELKGLLKTGLVKKLASSAYQYSIRVKIAQDLAPFKPSSNDVSTAVKKIEDIIKGWED